MSKIPFKQDVLIARLSRDQDSTSLSQEVLSRDSL